MSARDKRVIVAGVTIVTVAAVLLRGVPAARSFHAAERDEAVGAAGQLTSIRRAVSSSTALADSLKKLNARWEVEQVRLFNAPTLNGVTAQIASYLSRTARSAAVEIGSLQVRPDTSHQPGFRRLSVAVRARGDVAGLMTLLSTLENGPRAFRVTSLSVSQPDVVGRPNTPESLAIELSLAAFATGGSR